ncbi:MAG: patatin-like phospholipase family protein [Deltaproteobacteria bacterium]|nr:patatin-like phospholipase family protein [Deltaproteobacteria bacterium]MBI3388828.1 patatin-like phospholipase family protein [Deltaproteobacteria bacterium]
MSDNAAVSFKTVWDKEREAIAAARQRRAQDSGTPLLPDAKDPVGLAFSGGGIRSATFNLGVLQGLAELAVLPRIDYLSTVSGGGYIGSWLTAWIYHQHGVRNVYRRLEPKAASVAEPDGAREVTFLRAYSNYLTPRTGAFGADTWTAVSTYMRNLLLNLTILIGATAVPLLLPRAAMRGLLWFYFESPMSAALIAILLLAIASFFIGRNLAGVARSSGAYPRDASQTAIQLSIVLPILLAAYVASCAGLWFGSGAPLPVSLAWMQLGAAYPRSWRFALLGGACVYSFFSFLAFVGSRSIAAPAPDAADQQARAATPTTKRADDGRRSMWRWTVGSAPLAGAIGGVILLSFGKLAFTATVPLSNLGYFGTLIWGAPAVVGAITLAVIVHIGLMGLSQAELAREWWSRLGGWLLIYTLVWIALCSMTFYAPYALAWLAVHWARLTSGLTVAWVASTVGGLLAGHSAQTGARNDNPWLERLAAVAPYVFIVGLLSGLSLGIHVMLVRWSVTDAITLARLAENHWDLMWLTTNWWFLFTAFVLAGAAMSLSARVDINHFSLHMLYRNRLVRAYLGASNPHRHPQPFTGFDRDDDVELRELAAHPGPYPIINAALNLVSGDQLAWQQRKASSFVLTPLHCGAEDVGYRATGKYAGGNLTLGTAVAISGAAANPNMGYHSSPPLAFLMTVFNVRLGWWAGNPAHQHAWQLAGPRFGLRYLVDELLGLTDEASAFVNLSDGGHFENLGIYELVRRRCRFIIACDGGQDGDLTFEDLGNAIRKCRTDLATDIRIDVTPLRKQADSVRSSWHCAVGRIHYPDEPSGTLVYLKASLTGDEPTDVLNYASVNPEFPHQPTGDQWFDESQFESYRALGCHIATTVFEPAQAETSNEALFVTLHQNWYPPSSPGTALFTKHTAKFDVLIERLRQDPTLQFLDAQIYPQWDVLTRADARPIQLWLPTTYDELRNGFYFCCELIQLMEDAYLELCLDSEYAHPDNRGWMNLFKHWAWSGMLRTTWAMCASTYGARFQTFCDRRLDLGIGEVVITEATGAVVPELNSVEIELIRYLPPPTNEAPVRRIFLLQMAVQAPPDDPTRDTSRPPTNSAAGPSLRLTFGFTVVDSAQRSQPGKIVYFRVQDHLRKMGLARLALGKLLTTKGLTLDGVEPVTMPTDASEVPRDEDLRHFKRLFESAKREK